ncbi:MAG: hypothetical protein EXR70_01485 [Deltaproteobacteria bacterium]|nr:hypothetical protein [Deltaproteobacteria bacterium]
MANRNYRQFTGSALLIVSLMVALVGSVGPAWSSHEHIRNEINLFHDFLLNHPKVSAELRHNPNLANNKKYLAKHEDLAKFLKRHPDVKRELINHPSRVFSRHHNEEYARLRHR